MAARGFRFYLGHFAGKLSYALLRALGKNATYFPGDLAIKICPDYLFKIGKPEKVIAVTGTNGKTTVCNLLSDILTGEGYSVMNNHAGSNTNSGIATALMKYSGALGNSKCKIGILEVDERSSKKIYPPTQPDYIVCTNLFRDSITRNAHPEYISDIINSAVPKSTKMILNADDPISSRLALENERVYFSIDRLATDKEACDNIINDCQICPICGEKLKVRYSRYHHIGSFECPNGDYESPKADYLAKVDLDNGILSINLNGQNESFKLISNSIFNIYNQVTVISVLTELGISVDAIRKGLEKGAIVESRYSEAKVNGLEVITHLAKGHNPIACSCVFDYAVNESGIKEVLLFPDDDVTHMKTSENITWAYDADFERLNQRDVVRVVIGGRRSEDYRLRLLLAGVPAEKIYTCEKENEAYKLLKLDGTDKVFILHQVYKIQMAMDAKANILKEVGARE